MSTATVHEERQRPRRLRPLGHFVDRRVSQLQLGVLDRRSESIAALARLRRGVGKEVGELADLWQATLAGLPEPQVDTDQPTFEERAAYTAITLYALHQQSRTAGMHQQGKALGGAVAALARATNEIAVQRRFEALGTAETFAEVVHHARGLITQLRGASLGLDYGMFADQLYWLQMPDGAARVRLAWGRDYYYRPDRKQEASTAQTVAEPKEEA